MPAENPTPDQGVAARVRADREQAALDHRTLADLIGYSASHLRNVENGHRAVTEHFAQAVAAVLGTDPDRYTSRHRGGDDKA